MMNFAFLILQLTLNSAHATHDPTPYQLNKLARTCATRTNKEQWIFFETKPFQNDLELKVGSDLGDPIEAMIDPQIWVVICDVDSSADINISKPDINPFYTPISHLTYQLPRKHVVLLHLFSDQAGIWNIGFLHRIKEESHFEKFNFVTVLPPALEALGTSSPNGTIRNN